MYMELAEVSRIAARLDRVKESMHKGLVRWTLDGRLIARQLDATSIVIRTGFDERERLLVDHATTFFVPPRFDAHMMVVARLDAADPAAVEKAIRAAWDLQASAA